MVSPSLSDPVSDKDALRVRCPLCKREPGQRCVYISDSSEPDFTRAYGMRRIKHHKGAQTQKPHNQRRHLFAKARQEYWRLHHPFEASRLARASKRTAIVLAQREYERREANELREWLRVYGPILWDGLRPDGSLRGDPVWLE